VRTIDDDERRARLALRHGLAPAHRLADTAEVAEAIVALHATDPASVFLAARARQVDPSVAGSVACRPTIASATSAVSARRCAGASP